MLDHRLRGPKDRALAPVTRVLAPAVPAIAASVLSLGAAIGSAVAAASGLVVVSVLAWWLSRLLDGLDGPIARSRDEASDAGGLVDLLFDVIGYAAIPLGVAVGVDDRATWIAAAFLLASFYVNSVSLLHTAAVLERRGLGAAARGERTTTTMPRGLVEGTETIVFFTVFLAVPSIANTVFVVMGVAVLVTVAERTVWAVRSLR